MIAPRALLRNLNKGIKHKWAYMLLGQMVAISVAWSLALLASGSTVNQLKRGRLSLTVVIPVTLSFWNILVVPQTTASFDGKFLTNLTMMHALLFVPLLPVGDFGPKVGAIGFCAFLTVLGLVIRVRTTIRVLFYLGIANHPFFDMANYPFDTLVLLWHSPSKIIEAAWSVLHSHPAQASIGWDIVYTNLIWLVWSSNTRGEGSGTGASLLSRALRAAVASVGVAAPMELRIEDASHSSLKVS